MKIAVISDIHGNLPALEAVADHLERWAPDLVVVNGDIVNRGPSSTECLQIIVQKQQDAGWQLVRGNHEDYLLACSQPDFPQSGPAFEIRLFAYWTFQQLNGHISTLEAMPDAFSWRAPDGSELRVMHGSVRGNRDGIYPKTADACLRQQIAPAPAVFVTAHTHKPLLRQVDETLVMNVGAVGAPFDGDSRISYGQLTWSWRRGWQGKIERLPYDRATTERHYVESGFLAEAGPLAQLTLIEHRQSRGLIYRWASLYEAAVLAGDMTLADSVRAILGEDDVRPALGAPGWVL